MVKGMNKRVVVVKSPDPQVFEQAIFILKENGTGSGTGNANILKEAERVANEYLNGINASSRRLLHRLPAPVFALLGALLTGAVWLTLHLFGI